MCVRHVRRGLPQETHGFFLRPQPVGIRTTPHLQADEYTTFSVFPFLLCCDFAKVTMSTLVQHLGAQGDEGVGTVSDILLLWGPVLWSTDMCVERKNLVTG